MWFITEFDHAEFLIDDAEFLIDDAEFLIDHAEFLIDHAEFLICFTIVNLYCRVKSLDCSRNLLPKNAN